MTRKVKPSQNTQPPSLILLAMEGRVALDAASMAPMFALRRFLPRGDGHPVLFLPGFLTSSSATWPLRRYFAGLDYASHRWKLGTNLGYSEELRGKIGDRIANLHRRYGKKVSLVGWSLGGIYARELARDMPESVRQVITMGSPFRGAPETTNILRLYNYVTQNSLDADRELLDGIATPPPVPTTALYTRSDGIVAWQGTVENSRRRDVQNIHVGGPHVGLGFNARALIALADRLAQPEDNWQRFEPRGMMKMLFQSHYPQWLVGPAEPDWVG
ncbi:MAG: esterase/lipase family protein [Lysobacterales bacterium]